MGRPFKTYLNGTKIYSCSNCRCHSADHDDIISKVRYTRILPCSCLSPRSTRYVSAGFPRQTWPGVSVQQRVSRIAVHHYACISAPFLEYPSKAGLSCSVNVTLGPKEDRLLMTGLHTVADIFCSHCQTVLGWKYVSTWQISLPDMLSFF